MDISLIGGSSAIVITGILAEIVKRAGVPTKWIPLTGLVIGVLVVGFGTWTLSVENVLAGILLGAASSGLYDNLSKGLVIARGE